jgi:hypothetical protein
MQKDVQWEGKTSEIALHHLLLKGKAELTSENIFPKNVQHV